MTDIKTLEAEAKELRRFQYAASQFRNAKVVCDCERRLEVLYRKIDIPKRKGGGNV